MPLRVLDHPLADHLLAHLRDERTPPDQFRRFSKSLSLLLILEATRELETTVCRVRTPIEETDARRIEEPLAVVPVLRAGLGMLEPALDLFPDVTVGYIGLERHEQTAVARSYYCKLPNVEGKLALCLDPMLATGGSASQAVSLLKARNVKRVIMISVVASPEGIQRMRENHPDTLIVAAALDRCLDERKFIVPGLGDYGDRLFGTG